MRLILILVFVLAMPPLRAQLPPNSNLQEKDSVGGTVKIVRETDRSLAVAQGKRVTLYQPIAPFKKQGTIKLKEAITGMDTDGKTMVITTATNVYLYNVTDPANPVGGPVAFPWGSVSQVIRNHYPGMNNQFYTAEGFAGVRVSVLENGSTLVPKGLVDTPDYPADLAATTDGFFDYETKTLNHVNTTNPSVPVLDTSMTLASYPGSIAALNQTVFVGFGSPHKVTAYSFNSGLHQFSELGSLNLPGAGYPAKMQVTSGTLGKPSTLWIADSSGGFHAVDVHMPSAMTVRKSIPSSSNAEALWVPNSQNYAVLAQQARGADYYDITNLNSPMLRMNFPGFPVYDAFMPDAMHAYLACGPAGIKLFDVSSTPSLSGEWTFSFTPQAFASAAGKHFIAYGTGGVGLFDSTTLTQPRLLNRISISFPNGVRATTDSLVVAASAQKNLMIYDIQNMSAPQLRYALKTPGFAYDVELGRSTMWIADGTAGISQFTWHGANGTTPTLEHQVAPPQEGPYATFCNSLAMRKNVLYATCSGNYLWYYCYDWRSRLLDQIGVIRLISNYILINATVALVLGPYLEQFDVSRPEAPLPAGRFTEGGNFGRVRDGFGKYLLSQQTVGLSILEPTPDAIQPGAIRDAMLGLIPSSLSYDANHDGAVDIGDFVTTIQANYYF